MPLEIICEDITRLRVDAIVNAANSTLLGGGGVDGAIHRAAGPGLLLECRTLGGCPTGEARITGAYELLSKYVVHTVGPVWQDGKNGEAELLSSCYKKSLSLAKSHNVETIAFPLISAGVYGYPKAQALRVAVSAISEFLQDNDMTVFMVIYQNSPEILPKNLFTAITGYIKKYYVEEPPNKELLFQEALFSFAPIKESTSEEHRFRSLSDVVNNADETFSQMLLRLISEKNMSCVDVYKKANLDRKLFSKIRNDANYVPAKTTALAFAIALELNLDQTRDLLLRAGFALSRSNKLDIIVQYFIEYGNYNIFEINEALFAFEQNLLGAF